MPLTDPFLSNIFGRSYCTHVGPIACVTDGLTDLDAFLVIILSLLHFEVNCWKWDNKIKSSTSPQVWQQIRGGW